MLDSHLQINVLFFPYRSDKGGENVRVVQFMVQTQGENRSSHITGRSVHNQRYGGLKKYKLLK